ncbi:hypothetical protein BAUCODRAFT_493068 [Baudoinia panamericana UAMH 10762]|uniref:Uncharacterized protein n=1 Tax=Baudoinia panamericana (strain UAMH 10762) TaxID=717646 RepID=M2N8Y3_BAUPA|nr:uncharacterized protein BAUCODRAFT_493068 [Baudoinia panamericana UAMH 10762]EMC95534.1 hypothetical protein BAUCODRAFT_493068 [Baudoinia panamericana UAMH 10762]
MGRFSIISETAFSQPRDVVFDYACDPNNSGSYIQRIWRHEPPGEGTNRTWTDVDGSMALKCVPTVRSALTDTFQRVELPDNTYLSTWMAITVERPWRFAIQQQNNIAMKEDGTGGLPGITHITYTFEDVGEGVTLFTRNLTCELPRGVSLPDDLLTVCCRPQGIEKYHDAIKAQLTENNQA